MATVWTLTEESIRKLGLLVDTQQAEISNLRRKLAHYSTRRHEAVYLPGSKPVIVENDSGETIPPFGVMRVASVDTSETNDVYVVEKPNSTFKCRYLVNLDAEIEDGKRGKGTWLEKSERVLYNSSSGTPAIDEEWGAKNAQWTLEKNRPGFLITGGNETEDGNSFTRAKQHIVTTLKGKPDSSISLNSTGTVSIWMGASGSEAVTEYDITCRAWGAAVTSAKKVVVWFESGVWYVGPWEC